MAPYHNFIYDTPLYLPSLLLLQYSISMHTVRDQLENRTDNCFVCDDAHFCFAICHNHTTTMLQY